MAKSPNPFLLLLMPVDDSVLAIRSRVLDIEVKAAGRKESVWSMVKEESDLRT